jgi:hypothetical protein
MANTIRGLRASMRCSQLPSGPPFREAKRMTAIAKPIPSKGKAA